MLTYFKLSLLIGIYIFLLCEFYFIFVYSCQTFLFQKTPSKLLLFLIRILFIYIQREGKGGRKRGRDISMCGCFSLGPYWGPGPQPRHVPCLGIEQVVLWFTACSQSTELHQPKQQIIFIDHINFDFVHFYFIYLLFSLIFFLSPTFLGFILF